MHKRYTQKTWNLQQSQKVVDARRFCNLPRYCRCKKPAKYRLGKQYWCEDCGPKT